MMKEFLTRARFFFFRRSPAELDEELQFHLEQATEFNLAAGMDPEEARRQARVQFGGRRGRPRAEPRTETRVVVGHLNAGCPLCSARLSPQPCVCTYCDRHAGIGHRRHYCSLQRRGSDSFPQPALRA